MSNPNTKLKLKLNIAPAQRNSPDPNATPATPFPQSAVATPGGTKSLKLKFTNPGSQPPTPAVSVPSIVPTPSAPVEKPQKTKAGRTPKITPKLAESKKRGKDESESDNEHSAIDVSARPSKKLKIAPRNTKIAPSPSLQTPAAFTAIKIKSKGLPPKRPLGQGYDSEASDREEDPAIEEDFILRMMPGDDCDYLRSAIAEKKIGVPVSQGGADIHLRFYHAEGRRASVSIRGNPYAATLVDLPCIVEGMKSWDKRGWWKSADICQMLWVYATLDYEEEARTCPLPDEINDETFHYPHGLTPPMHYARKRRFRKRISRTAIEKVEAAVERLLAADAAALSTRYEMIDPVKSTNGFTPESGPEGPYSEDEDAEGDFEDSGYFNTQHSGAPEQEQEQEEDNGDDLQELLDAEMAGSMAATPSSAVAGTPLMANGGDNSVLAAAAEEEEDSGDESVEDDDDDEEGGNDSAEKARLEQIQGLKEDIAEMEQKIDEATKQLAVQQNKLLRTRIENSIRNMKTELQLKISALDEGDDD